MVSSCIWAQRVAALGLAYFWTDLIYIHNILECHEKGEQSNRGGALQVSLPFRQSTQSCGKPEEVLQFLLKKSCCQGHTVKLDRNSHKSLRAGVFFSKHFADLGNNTTLFMLWFIAEQLLQTRSWKLAHWTCLILGQKPAVNFEFHNRYWYHRCHKVSRIWSVRIKRGWLLPKNAYIPFLGSN